MQGSHRYSILGEVGGQCPAGLIVEVQVASLAALVADREPSSLAGDVGVLYAQPGDIADTAARPEA